MDLLEFGNKSELTHDHLYLTGRIKMRVKLAAQVLSYNVASAICNVNVASEGKKLSDCLQTAKFFDNMDLLFDLCNGAGHRDKQKSQRCLVTRAGNPLPFGSRLEPDPPRAGKYYRQMSTWKYVKRVTHKDGTVHVNDTVPPCLSGWRDNLEGSQRLWTTLKTIGFTEMNLRRFNSDPIENLFSVIRQTNGSNRSPTCKQFEYSLKTCIVNGMSHYHIRSKNCLDDDGAALYTEEELFSRGDLAVNSNLFVPEKRTFLTRGQPLYLANLMKAQPFRQTISLQCNKVCAKVLKKCAMDCQICRTAVLHQDVNLSSDHMSSAHTKSQRTIICP
ncbi:Transposable element P transposase [Frankliniella fusca]|uniref:Transposable element P transposase n=1 Tax=Frankliniella fusca TaxID=407009 RepID=A0AAE1HIA9_9NEOP|nr:Transposable element P transposase [Frankliniella fusca]